MTMLEAILLLFAGVGVFIAGMNMLSDGLEHSAGGSLKRLLGTISGNRFAGVGIGAGVTAIIQSSSATSVMVIGFVNAGIMTLFQAVAIIMGANIGTTITGIIVSLKALPVSDFAMLLAFIGVMMTFFKSDRVKQIGNVLCGFGLIFVGLELMGNSLKNSAELNAFFISLFQKINFPLLLILCGTVFTALIQSSSAATGIFISMVGAGSLTLGDAIFLVLGSNIGTCITAVLACIGTTTNAKRTALIHLTFNVIGTILFTAIIWPLKRQVVELLSSLPVEPEMRLAWFHVVFNVSTTLVLLPFIKQLVKFAMFLIKDKEEKEEETLTLRYVDDLLLKTPPVAIMQTKREIEYMASLARTNIERSLQAFQGDGVKGTELMHDETVINFTNKALTKYLIKLSPLVSHADERHIGAYFHVLNDLERIGDHAKNFYEISTQMQNENLQFSEIARQEIQRMGDAVLQMFAIAQKAFEDNATENLAELTRLENVTDECKRTLTQNHFNRLAEGNCSMESGAYFFSVVIGLERVADHLVNVGFSVLNPTGSQSEAREKGEIPQLA